MLYKDFINIIDKYIKEENLNKDTIEIGIVTYSCSSDTDSFYKKIDYIENSNEYYDKDCETIWVNMK